MSEHTTTLRLRRVRFKDGRTIEVTRPKSDTVIRDKYRERTTGIGSNSMANKMAGFVVVAWSRDGFVSVAYENGDLSPVAAGQVPQYVKDVLLAEMAVCWSRD